MPQLPPWLNIGPRDYLSAGEAGARLGLELAGIEQQANEFAQNVGLKRDEIAQQQALEAADMSTRIMGMKVQLAKFLDDRKQQELQNSLVIDEHRRNQDREDQKLAFDKVYKQQLVDWHKTQVETQQKRQQLQAQQAADQYSAQQEAEARIAAGELPAKVYSELAPRLRVPMSSLASLIRESQPRPTAATDISNQRTILEKEIARLSGLAELDTKQAQDLENYRKQLNTLLGIAEPAAARPQPTNSSSARTILGVNVPSSTGNIKRIVPVPESNTQPAQVSPPHDESENGGQ